MSDFDTSGNPGSGPLVIHQPRKGYRYSIDSFLLASFVVLKKRANVIDLGSGVGVIGLLLCTRYPDCTVWGIEIQERLFRFARDNSRENGLEGRLINVLGDLRQVQELPKGVSFDAAVSNPPYRPVGTGRRNQDDERTVARHETSARLSDVIAAAGMVLKPGGMLSLIYPAWRTADVLTMLRSGGFEPKRVRFIHARRDQDAKMVMTEARRGGGTQLTVLPPLYVWEGQGIYTDEVGRIVGQARPNSY
jgi:tRNA1Val (adenine37-N6)-methyltransferase